MNFLIPAREGNSNILFPTFKCENYLAEMDFTIKKYIELLQVLINGEHDFQTLIEFVNSPSEKTIIIRHDVEKHFNNALKFAIEENKLNIKGTYFFRFSKHHFNPQIINEILELGHEIGYHYDDLSKCKGDYVKAYERFQNNLETLRKIAPVKTICMDGSPLSKHNNLDLWSKYDYKAIEVIAEPYLDVNFNEVSYLTDTGRRWDGYNVSVRDKVRSDVSGYRNAGLRLRSTDDIIRAFQSNRFPNKILMTFHPQRWTDKSLPWIKELVFQRSKNIVKRFLVN